MKVLDQGMCELRKKNELWRLEQNVPLAKNEGREKKARGQLMPGLYDCVDAFT